MNTTTTESIKTVEIGGVDYEVKATVYTVKREDGYSRGYVDVSNWTHGELAEALFEVGTPESKTLVRVLAGMFDIALPSLRVKSKKHGNRVSKFYAVFDADANTFQHVQFHVARVGYFAEQARRDEERQAKWEARENAEEARRQKALEIGTKAMTEFAHLRITEMEVEVDGLVFEVTKRGWNHGDVRIEVRHSPINATRNYGSSELGYDIKPNKTLYPTNAERAAAEYDATVMC